MGKAFLRIEKLIKGKVEDYDQWQEIPLEEDSVLIARPSADPDAIAPDIKIIGDDYISRTPVEVSYSVTDKCYTLRDHGTTNGTFLNGEPVEPDRVYRLTDYDLIGLAKIQGDMRVLLRFRVSHKTQPGWVEEEQSKPPAKRGLAVNLAARKVFVDGKHISLTRKEWKVIEVLYNNRGMVCTVDDISWEVWGEEGASPELVAKYIQRLRDKIEPDRSNPRFILTHTAGGYVLDF